MRRRLVLILASVAALVGGSAMMAAPANADVVHVPTIDAGLLRLCVIYSAADAGLCLHV